MELEFNKLSDRELLLLIMQEQKNQREDFKSLKLLIESKADGKRMEEIEKDVKDLRKTQWLASGAVGSILWVVSHFMK